MTGYSGTPLARKLGLKDGQSAAFAALPESLSALAGAAAFRDLQRVDRHEDVTGEALDYIHLFTDRAATVAEAVPALRARMAADGIFWMSWPKKASRRATDVTEDVIRAHALADVLVDVKVCAVDEVWSGLKLMIRRDRRSEHLKGV